MANLIKQWWFWALVVAVIVIGVLWYNNSHKTKTLKIVKEKGTPLPAETVDTTIKATE